MEREAIFLDSYAICAIVDGSESYKRFASGERMITTRLNLMEAYYGYLVRKGLLYAEFVFDRFRYLCVHVTDEDLKESMSFKAAVRKSRPKSNLSYIDAVGYVVAKNHKTKFLTGDKEFTGMENVEFVK